MAACLLLPWINPFAAGPSPTVHPWLASALCAAAFAAAGGLRRIPWGLALACMLVAAWAFARSGVTLDTLALAGGLVLVALAASAARAFAATPEGAPTIAGTWVAAAVISTFIALAQYFDVAALFAPFASASPNGDAFANLRQRNQFASLTAIGFASLAWFVGRRGLGIASAMAAVLLAVGNAATTSRTGMLELLVLAALAAAWPGERRAERIRLAALALVAYFAATWTLPWLHDLAGSGDSLSIWRRTPGGEGCSSRRVLWANVLQLVAQRPWTGWGWGELDYAHFSTLYDGARFCDILDNAHNLPLHVAVELGVPATLLLAAAGAWATLRARPWAEADGTRRLAWSVLAVLFVHSMLEYPLWYGPFQLAAGLCLGVLSARGDVEAPRGRWRALLPAAVALAVAFVAYDYRRMSQIYLQPEARAAAYRENTLEHVRRSRIFSAQARFAELTLAPLTRENAQWSLDESLALLHYSPEPKLIEKAVESATMLGRDDVALWHLARFRAAFPEAHAEWAAKLGLAGDS